MSDLFEVFNKSLQTGFIDKAISSEVLYQPNLIVNSKRPPQKVLTTIIQELRNCDSFLISVAFVTTGGVATLINTLKELEDKKIKGKILVSQYLNFTQPEALKRLLQLKNIELRIATKENSHSKGYIFKSKNCYNLIIGSSNLTDKALTTNKEWNLKVSALESSGIVKRVLDEFESDFEVASVVNDEFISNYEEIYRKQFLSYTKSKEEFVKTEITPNSMQQEALENLNSLRLENKNRALIISATGTGKTYLSAFDAKSFGPDKLLFIVHRRTIAESSLKTFQNVFGETKSMGLYSGNKVDLDSDFIFATVQTISKSNHLENFEKNHFDYIIIDESHRSGADSYLRVIDYFEPKFLLGMTATPERTDGNDIFQLFDHNIAYEIRLQRAMEEEMLSSFHYYGVSDLLIEEKSIEDKSKFNQLFLESRVEKLISTANFYGCDNGVIRGLVFCSRKEEALELSRLFNLKGFRTVALTGDSAERERSDAINKIELDNLDEKLDYIFTVDIFNEGIDIPSINQVIMVRPTQSAIIFIQQLGRGLRKIEGKSYLTVIDFIGNFDNNYLIPIALYGDTSYNKDSLRKLVSGGSQMIPGESTINFDEISKERIFQSIDTANMQLLSDLKKDYNLLKYRLGRVPMMVDFIENGSRDPILFVNYSNSHYNFVKKVDSESIIGISTELVKLLELFSKEINNSKRVEECIILLNLIRNNAYDRGSLNEFLKKTYNYEISEETIISCVANLNFEFFREKKDGKLMACKDIYDFDILKYKDGIFTLSDGFRNSLKEEGFKNYLIDSITYSIYQFDKLFDAGLWRDGFVLYRKYSRKDVFRILNYKENPVAQNVGGYLVSPDNSNCPIFVNYHKEEDISESTKYEDEFINNREFNWMSKSNRKLGSKDVQSILGQNGEIRLPLFVKKNNDEGTEFYFMGNVSANHDMVEQTVMKNDKGSDVSVVKIRFNLADYVSNSIYNYLTEVGVLDINDDLAINSEKELDKSNDPEIVSLNNPIPLYDFYAAAGSFSEMQSEKEYTMIEGPTRLIDSEDYYACKVIGESMNRVIPNGSVCLFKKYSGGTRNGRVVLVENMDYQDPDFNSAFTIKTYSSKKVVDENGWKHSSIVLIPNSTDMEYKEIVLDVENSEGMRIVGEFIEVLKT